jgi:hypothetical protein
MRRSSVTLILAIFLLGTIASDCAFARGGNRGHGGRSHASGSAHFHRSPARVGVVVTAPLFYGGYRAPYYYYPPMYGYPPAAYPSTYYYPPAQYYPPEYIEQPAPSQEPAPAYWYYCPAVDNYYPYVETCPGGWQQVVPQQPPS